MKKRLLALALCLVMMTSLLPLTAAAATIQSISIQANGLRKDNFYPYYLLDGLNVSLSDGTSNPVHPFFDLQLDVFSDLSMSKKLTQFPQNEEPFFVRLILKFKSPDDSFSSSPNFSFNMNCHNIIESYILNKNDKERLIRYKVTSAHNWKFTVSENRDKLTAQCQNKGCNFVPVSVTLKADSVTLPESPFNARLEGWDQFHNTFRTANPVFDYRCDGEPADQSNPKAGKYQAGVAITNLPGTVVDANGNQLDGAYLNAQYTVHQHNWVLSQPDSGTLTATCNSGCTIGEVTVKLKAHSVTLPDSPFNATVETSENFKEVFTYSDIEYKYHDTDGWKVVDPKTFTPKPGEYQAKVYINSLSGNGGAVARAASNGSPNYVYVKYTAIDPAVTAQTGDNRPIELMLGSVVVFSALAAAAFIVDSKRRYQQ